LEVFTAILSAVADGSVSGKFPHRVVELLDGYLTETSPLAATSLEPLKNFPLVEVVLREFRHALDRQGQHKQSRSFTGLAELPSSHAGGALSRYLGHIAETAAAKLAKAKSDAAKWNALADHERRRMEIAPSESPIAALIGLCQTVAFIERNLPEGNQA
jgi:hypothetical protein